MYDVRTAGTWSPKQAHPVNVNNQANWFPPWNPSREGERYLCHIFFKNEKTMLWHTFSEFRHCSYLHYDGIPPPLSRTTTAQQVREVVDFAELPSILAINFSKFWFSRRSSWSFFVDAVLTCRPLPKSSIDHEVKKSRSTEIRSASSPLNVCSGASKMRTRNNPHC